MFVRHMVGGCVCKTRGRGYLSVRHVVGGCVCKTRGRGCVCKTW